MLGLLPGVARSQGTRPLRKAELVQLLATRGLSNRDIAALVRRNCVTFQPSERDRRELRAAGADEAVVAAVDQCVRARARPAPTPRAPPGGAAALHVLTPTTVAAAAGTDATVVVQLVRGTVPQSGVELRLRGTSAIPGGLAHDPSAITDQRGVATFFVRAGTTVGTYPLAVVPATGAAIGRVGGGRIDLVTTPGQVASAKADPAEVTRGAVTISVVDPYDNAVPDVPLELRPVTAELTGALQGTTDDRGQIAFTFAPGSVRRAGAVGVFSRGARIGAFTVRLGPQVLADEGTRFGRGASQHGVAGTPLGEPLIFQVRDTSGAPIVGERVTFAATNGDVAPAATETDSSGAVAVRVTLGTYAGPVTVSARVRTLTRTGIVYADPGPARQLVVERDSASVAGTLTVRSRDTLVLRIGARDAYGNEAPLGAFTATTTGSAIALRSASVAGSHADVALEPQRSGAGAVQISASGLETQVPVDVTLPAPQGSLWALGVRAAWLGVNHPWVALANVQGISGADMTLTARRTLRPGLALALGATIGAVNVDTTGGSTSAIVVEGSARAELALLPRRRITPLVSLGGGGYRLKSGSKGQPIYHTNLFWAGGVGVDAAVSPRLTAELRVERQWMTDSSVGHVGTLWPVEAGLRVAL